MPAEGHKKAPSLDDRCTRPPRTRRCWRTVSVCLATAAPLARWVDDFRCINQSVPIVLVTADHGFTYGPPPDRSLDGGEGMGGVAAMHRD